VPVLKKIAEFLGIYEDVSGVEQEEIENLLFRERLSKYVMPTAFDEELELFLCDDDTVGFGFKLYPKVGVGQDTVTIMKNIFNDPSIPEDTIVQWTFFASPYFEDYLKDYVSRREEKTSFVAKRYAQFLKEHRYEGFYNSWNVPVRDGLLFATFKIPCKIDGYEGKSKDIADLRDSIHATLSQAGLYPKNMTPYSVLKFYYLILNPSHDVNSKIIYDEETEIREQAICHDTLIEQYDSFCKVDGFYTKALTIKKYPSTVSIAQTLEFTGSVMSRDRNQINVPFTLSLLLRKATRKEKGQLLKKAEIVMKQQNFSALSTRLQQRQEDFVHLTRNLEEGEILWKGCVVWNLMSQDYEKLRSSVQVLKNFMSQKSYELQEELLNLPFFLSATPFNLVREFTEPKFQRFKTFISDNVSHLLPIQWDWKGTGTPTIPLLSRRGQLMFIDLWDTNGGMNGIVTAPMGKGKSVLVNHIVVSYRSLPKTVIRIIDVGRSYEGIARLFNGEFVDVTPDDPIVVNPFSEIEDLDKQMKFLVDIVDKMIKPNERCSDTERGMIQIAIKEALSKHGDKTDIRHVRDEIFSIGRQEGKEEFLKLAEFNLAPWCDGQYAKFFIGRNEVNFKDRLVVLELGAVKDNRELMSLLLMTLFFHINKEIYLGDRSIKKLVIWDEAWRFFQDKEMLKFIEQGAREYRKFNGSIITITQNISDFQMNDVTKVLKSTADFMFILEQKPEEWEKIHRDKELDISDFEKDVLKTTLKTLKGYWSEIYMVTPRGRGIGRLILSPFFYWLYTTDAHDVAIRQKFMAESSSIEEAIQKCIEHTAKR